MGKTIASEVFQRRGSAAKETAGARRWPIFSGKVAQKVDVYEVAVGDLQLYKDQIGVAFPLRAGGKDCLGLHHNPCCYCDVR